jgi:hypothetical protein
MLHVGSPLHPSHEFFCYVSLFYITTFLLVLLRMTLITEFGIIVVCYYKLNK